MVIADHIPRLRLVVLLSLLVLAIHNNLHQLLHRRATPVRPVRVDNRGQQAC